MRLHHTIAWIGLLGLAAPLSAQETRPARAAVLIEGEPFDGELLEIKESTIVLAPIDAPEGPQTIPLKNLLKWGELRPAVRRPTLLLRQGSRLIAAPAWSLEGSLRYAEGVFTLRQTVLDDAQIDRSFVSMVLLEAVRDPVVFANALREAGRYQGDTDRLWLASGDAFSGTLTQIDRGELTFEVAGQSHSYELGEVVLLKLGGESQQPESLPALALGLRDGGLLLAEAATLGVDNQLSVRLTDQLKFTGNRNGAVTLVQPMGTGDGGERVTYLSDLTPLDYRQTPYFDLPWDYRRDTSLDGGPLVAGGRHWLKGLAMHSAARLVYRVEPGAKRFASQLAVAEPLGAEPRSSEPAGHGSAVFRVFVAREGKFSQAYESAILRWGDEPAKVSVDVADAQAIALTVDYADGGDAGDHAVWLGARFVK